jgi:hypothetical protein
MAERVRVRAISNQEGNRLLRIVRRGTGSVVTWRRAQMVLLSAQAMDVAQIARVTFTSEDRVRDVIHNFNADGFEALYPRYRGGRPPRFTLPERREDISHEGLRSLLDDEGVSFPAGEDLQGLDRPRLRGQEEPGPGAVRDRRRDPKARTR